MSDLFYSCFLTEVRELLLYTRLKLLSTDWERLFIGVCVSTVFVILGRVYHVL